MDFEYKRKKNDECNRKAELLLKDLHFFCRTFLVGREGRMSPSTRLTYMQRIHKFFAYLHDYHPLFSGRKMTEYTLEDFSRLETEHIEAFASWIRHGGSSNGSENAETSVNNYLSALNMFWRYFVTHGKLQHNPVANVERAGKPHRTIVRLNENQEEEFLDSVAGGLGLTDHQSAYHDKTAIRDTAICLTLIRTGIRVSELVGLNLEDLNLTENCFRVMRKRNKEDVVFFDDEVRQAISEYLEVRSLSNPEPAERALFLVTIGRYKGTRLSVRSVQLLVKKYAKAGSPGFGSKITPHKLRATYATDMLKATGNIALVQEALNHESPTTTMLYADSRTMDLKNARNILMEERRRKASLSAEDSRKDEAEKGTIFKKELKDDTGSTSR